VAQLSRIKDLPDFERPRERLAALGADALSHAELIAILLRTGLRGQSAIEIGKLLIAEYKTLGNLSRATLEELQKIKGIGRDKAVTLKAAFTMARRMAAEIPAARPLLDDPESIANHMREQFRDKEVEEFHAVLLDTRRRLIRTEQITTGTLDSAIVHAREVFRKAITANASALVLVHNHPSGDPTPSKADLQVTRDLIRAGQLLKIEILDHVILGQKTTERDRDYVSLKEMGYFYQ
jgi:DNA repair protein RadC